MPAITSRIRRTARVIVSVVLFVPHTVIAAHIRLFREFFRPANRP